MAGATLGTPGLILTWLCYLLLLYTLLSAYISGGADVLGGLLQQAGWTAKPWQLATTFTLFFGLIVRGGIRPVDLLNRSLMFAKLAVYALLVAMMIPYVHHPENHVPAICSMMSPVMVLITSFGFAIIVPNLRDYFNDDVRTLKKVILIGSLIPLFCYIAWDAVIMNSLPLQGEHGLATLAHSDHTTSTLATLLVSTVHHSRVIQAFNSFTSICMLTAFLGVSLCLISFLSDGLSMQQQGKQGWMLFILTFLPPWLVVLYAPGAYLHALHYAGFCCVVLLLLLPALMSYVGRPRATPLFVVPGGRPCALFTIACAIALLVFA